MDTTRLLSDIESVISQASSARRGEISGKLAEAGYNSAIAASNHFWEWYTTKNSQLNEAIRTLRDAKQRNL